MKKTNDTIFLYLITKEQTPDGYKPYDCLLEAVVAAPSPGMALAILQEGDRSENLDYKDFLVN